MYIYICIHICIYVYTCNAYSISRGGREKNNILDIFDILDLFLHHLELNRHCFSMRYGNIISFIGLFCKRDLLL